MATAIPVEKPAGLQDLTGKRVGRWEILYWSHATRKSENSFFHYWVCQCDCGTKRAVEMYSLVAGRTLSCRCYMREHNTTHGLSRGLKKHPLYGTWKSMWARCTNPKNTKYSRYGGRGIEVDPAWRNFETFLTDMLPSWKKGTTLDREDNDGPYSKTNCRWATKLTQMNNTSRSRYLTYKGQSHSLSEWVRLKKTTVPYPTLVRRINCGWPVHDALMTVSGGPRPPKLNARSLI